MTKPKFKNKYLQEHYENCRRFGQDPSSSFYIDGHPHGGAGHRSAYWSGREGRPNRFLRTSLAYAAWAAGKDDMKKFGALFRPGIYSRGIETLIKK